MRFLYTIGIYLYTLGVRVASLFNSKARLMVRGWCESRRRIWQMAKEAGDAPIAWFHASSLGEFEQARPVLEKFRKAHPDYRILLTFFSPSGYEVRKDYAQADVVCYLPMDTLANARRLAQTLSPRMAFFVKYDFWFNYLDALRRCGARTYIFSAIFRPTQYFFRWYGAWFRQQLGRCYDHLFVQNDESLMLLRGNGITQCSKAGDTRFDRVHAISVEARRIEGIERFADAVSGCPIVVAGSSWEPDEGHLQHYMAEHPATVRYILAPHVISDSHLSAIIRLFGNDNCIRYSQLDAATDAELRRRVLIIDNIGMLSAIYRYATVAYIGGGFGHGIHNTLEAVAFAKPVVFGPRYEKFQEAHDLIANGGGFAYSTYEQLQKHFDNLLVGGAALESAERSCRDYMNLNLGSSDAILAVVERQAE